VNALAETQHELAELLASGHCGEGIEGLGEGANGINDGNELMCGDELEHGGEVGVAAHGRALDAQLVPEDAAQIE
jgi:hypothetical protein